VLRGLRLLAAAWATTSALAAPPASAQTDATAPPSAAARPAPATPGNLSREEKRCNAALRRVERHRETIAETRKAQDANLRTAENCATKRACEQASHRERSLLARRERQERQLAQLEAEARNLCDAPTAAPRL